MRHSVSATDRRGQLVLIAAVVVAVALVPVVLASLQLGYHADVRASGDYDDSTTDATATLNRALYVATADVPETYDWSQRADAVQRVRDRLDPRIEAIERAQIEAGIARSVGFNRTVAQQWATASCPGGTGRDFGPCVAIDGVVVQDRAGQTHVLGIVVDLTVTTERARTMATVEISTVAARR